MAPLSKQLTWDTLLIAFMPVKTFRPLTPSTRYIAYADYSDITKSRPEKDLVEIRKRTGAADDHDALPAPLGGGGAKHHKRRDGVYRPRQTARGTRLSTL